MPWLLVSQSNEPKLFLLKFTNRMDYPNCYLCDQQLQETDAKSNLPCGHTLHTRCLVQSVYSGARRVGPLNAGENANAYAQCFFCQTPFLQIEEHQQVNYTAEDFDDDDDSEDSDSETASVASNYYMRLRNRFLRDREFETAVKGYMKQKRICNKKKTALRKVVVGKRDEIKNSVRLLQDQIKSLFQVTKRSIKSSQAYREYNGAYIRRKILGSQIRNRYDCSLKDLRHALKDLNGYKRWGSEYEWSSHPSSVIRLGLRRYLRV